MQPFGKSDPSDARHSFGFSFTQENEVSGCNLSDYVNSATLFFVDNLDHSRQEGTCLVSHSRVLYQRFGTFLELRILKVS